MKSLLSTTALTFILSTPTFAAGTHSDGHSNTAGAHGQSDDGHAHEHEMMVGKPGDPAKVDRTIGVTMRETDDGKMLFEPVSLKFSKGETIRFKVTNIGEIEHEFVIDTVEGNIEHKEAMAMRDMEHADPNSVRLAADESGEVIWTFSNAGTFEFACLIPGHYESGMYGPIMVSE